VLECARQKAIVAGDHTILIGLVLRATSDPAQSAHVSAMVHLGRRFRRIADEPLHGIDTGPDLPWFS